MQKVIKVITVAATILSFCVLFLNAIFYYYLPSSYNVSTINNYCELPVFGVSLKSISDNDTVPVTNNTLNSNSTTKGQLVLGNIIPIKNVDINLSEDTMVIPGGTPFGIKIFTHGVIVVKIDSIKENNNTFTPASDAGIEIGDIILKANNKNINSNEELIEIVKNSEGNQINLILERNEKEIETILQPVNTGNNQYRIGIWVRDSSAGIGTVTFYDPKTKGFAGLGHGICDVDTGNIMPLAEGDVVKANIDGVTPAQKGKAGTLNGHHDGSDPIGHVICNCETGVYGFLNGSPNNFKAIPVAFKQEVKTGKAKIITTLDDNIAKYYDIEIESINYNENSKTKNLVIKITDKNLLEKTNGIVQGMSGSPIIQNGKLVGAVTHVFVNEPNKGYGIFAENMLLDFDKENRNIEEPAA